MYLSSLTAIGIWLLYSDRVLDLYGFVFNMLFISGWNAIEIATIESYPTHLRYACVITVSMQVTSLSRF
jgi:hypothetical protein